MAPNYSGHYERMRLWQHHPELGDTLMLWAAAIMFFFVAFCTQER